MFPYHAIIKIFFRKQFAFETRHFKTYFLKKTLQEKVVLKVFQKLILNLKLAFETVYFKNIFFVKYNFGMSSEISL